MRCWNPIGIFVDKSAMAGQGRVGRCPPDVCVMQIKNDPDLGFCSRCENRWIAAVEFRRFCFNFHFLGVSLRKYTCPCTKVTKDLVLMHIISVKRIIEIYNFLYYNLIIIQDIWDIIQETAEFLHEK